MADNVSYTFIITGLSSSRSPSYARISYKDINGLSAYKTFSYSNNSVTITDADITKPIHFQCYGSYSDAFGTHNFHYTFAVNETGLYNSPSESELNLVPHFTATTNPFTFNVSATYVSNNATFDGYGFFDYVPTLTVDLSSLEDWGDVTTGSHTLKVKAKATGYRDSELSQGVSFTKGASGYTVTVQQSSSSYPSGDTDTEVYDGQDNTGTLLGTIASDDYTSHTYTVTSGYIAIVNGTPENKGTTSGGVSYVGTFDDYGWYYSVTADGSITDFKFICLTGDSLVTMADGTQKRLDEIEIGDSVLSFDWETKDLIARKVIFTDKDENKSFTEFDRWIFADGTEIKTVHRHEFYNVEKGGMAYMDTWKIGDHAYRIDGSKIALVGHENVKETVKHYKITLEGDTNYFVHGLLNGDRNCPKEKL